MKKFLMAIATLSVLGTASAQSVQSLRSDRVDLVGQKNRTLLQVGIFVLNNKLASAAVFASATGTLAYLLDKLDPDARAALVSAGGVGILYCLWNQAQRDECLNAADVLARHGTTLSRLDKSIESIDSQLARLTPPAPPSPAPGAPTASHPAVVQVPGLTGAEEIGPVFHPAHPGGFYPKGDARAKIQLLQITKEAARKVGGVSVANMQGFAEKSASSLHVVDGKYRYLLLDPDSLAVFKVTVDHLAEEATESMVGIGISFEKVAGHTIRVARVYEESPASRVGLQAGDQITAIGGESVTPWTSDQTRSKLRRQSGEEVGLTVIKANGQVVLLAPSARQFFFKGDMKSSAYVGVYRDSSGHYFQFTNAGTTWTALTPGQLQQWPWQVGGMQGSIQFGKPVHGAESSGRVISYRFDLN